MCLLIGTVSQVSDVAHGPLVLLFCTFLSCFNTFVLYFNRIQNMKTIDGKPEYKGATVSVSDLFFAF